MELERVPGSATITVAGALTRRVCFTRTRWPGKWWGGEMVFGGLLMQRPSIFLVQFVCPSIFWCVVKTDVMAAYPDGACEGAGLCHDRGRWRAHEVPAGHHQCSLHIHFDPVFHCCSSSRVHLFSWFKSHVHLLWHIPIEPVQMHSHRLQRSWLGHDRGRWRAHEAPAGHHRCSVFSKSGEHQCTGS